MSRRNVAVSGLLFLCLACGMEDASTDATTSAASGQRLTTSPSGFTLEWTPSPSPLRVGANTLSVVLHNADGTPLTDSALGFDASMPAHGHGLASPPSVSADGEGRFSLTRVQIPMGGRWRFAWTVRTPQGTDHVQADVDVR